MVYNVYGSFKPEAWKADDTTRMIVVSTAKCQQRTAEAVVTHIEVSKE
jgi:hypothetical protein